MMTDFNCKNMIKIPEKEVKKRFQKLRNYENILYPQLKERSDRLRVKNKALKEENDRLKKENKQIEKLQLELEELRAMKFGKKRTGIKKTGIIPRVKRKKQRCPETYRREIPKPEEITDNLRMELEICPDCGSKLIDKKEHTHYREDLYEAEKLIESAKKIVQTIVESGRCPSCGERKQAMEIPKQKVIIGQNIRNMVVYLCIVQGQSYEETQKSLKHQYGIDLSNGEIRNILEGESRLVTPYYEYIINSLFEEAAHYDETSWKTKSFGKKVSEGNYCWVKIGVKSDYQIFWFGKSRGKGVAEQLRGEKKGSRGVSDDYGAYRDLFEYHELCWAHPHRKLRDLAESDNLKEQAKRVSKKAFKDFGKVYKQARKAGEKLKGKKWTEAEKNKELQNLKTRFSELFQETKYDPEKLKAIRKSLNERMDKYFTFFKFPDLPLDNNKAERAIRKIVLKRKKSFNCRSQEGADTLSVLYSVVFSLMNSNPDENFFTLYNSAIDFEPKE